MKQKRKLLFFCWIGLLCASPLFFGGMSCSSGILPNVAELNKFESCEDLESYIREVAIAEVKQNSGGSSLFSSGTPSFSREMAMSNEVVSAPQSAGSSSKTSQTFTGTNNQVQSVDEADIVKNDGNFLYVLNQKHLTIVKAWPANEMKQVSQFSITGTPLELFVHNDMAVVFSEITSQKNDSIDIFLSHQRKVYSSLTKILLLNIRDRSNPVVVREITTEGQYKSSRRINDSVRVLLYSNMELPTVPYSGDDSDSLPLIRENKQRDRQIELIQKTTLKDWLPIYEDKTFSESKEISKKVSMLNSCNSFYKPSVMAGRGIVTLVSIDLMNPKKNIEDTALVSNYQNVFASAKSLYVSGTPLYEKAVFGDGIFRTYLHKFDISDATQPAKYVASGSVVGNILNQFSMDEHKGYFRVATTSPTNDSSNGLYVLDQQGSSLELVGKVENLAKGERIYSARLVGDRGYIVTFRQIDPLFTLDLQDPKNPKVVGELKIPGFSTYLHPLDANHLLAIGQDGGDFGSNGKIQLSIFDVTDFKNPKQKYKFLLGSDSWGNSSEALYNHKAFQYYEAKGILAIPMATYGYSMNDSFVADALLFRVSTEKGIESMGKISHNDLYKQDFATNTSYSYEVQSYFQIRRSFFIEDYVYTISGAGAKVNWLEDLSKDIAPVVKFPKLLTQQKDTTP